MQRTSLAIVPSPAGPALWPAQASQWYALYEKYFWQRDWLAAGFRENPVDYRARDWSFDVDSGPVLRGNGFAACAFGIAAARRNGRFDHAYPLSVEAIALSWPLPGGRLLVPRLVSNFADAPYLGEAALMFQFSTQPLVTPVQYHTGPLPAIVFVCLALYVSGGALGLRMAHGIVHPRKRMKRDLPARRGPTMPAVDAREA